MALKGKNFIASLAAVLLAFATATASFADRDEDYELGVEAYDRGNFRVASQYFLSALREGNSNAVVMLYLAHSYAAQGQYKLALPVYRNIRDNFEGTPEAAQAGNCVVRLENPAAYAAGRSDKAPNTFYNRIKVVFPKPGQPAVSKVTITTVQKAITAMPRAIYQILDTGLIQVTIANSSPDQSSLSPATLAGKNICVFEHAGKSSNRAFTQNEIKDSFLLQAARAISACSGGLEKDPDFHNAYKLDLKDLPAGSEAILPYLAPPANQAEAEVCAAILSGLSGGQTKQTEAAAKLFPKTRAWIINKLRLQS